MDSEIKNSDPGQTVFAVTGIRSFKNHNNDKHNSCHGDQNDFTDCNENLSKFIERQTSPRYKQSHNYKPNYHAGLAPIYEDMPQDYFQSNGSKFSYSSANDLESKLGLGNAGFQNNYEEIDTLSMDQNKQRSQSSRDVRTYKKNKNMLNDIMNNRARMHRNSEPYSMQYKQKVHFDLESDNDCETMSNSSSKSSVSSQSTSQSRYCQDIARCSSLYVYRDHKCHGTLKTPALEPTNYPLYGNDRGSRYPKFDSDQPRQRNYLCPAEEKIKKRVFAGCFIVVGIVIVVLLVLVIEGWVLRDSSKAEKGVIGDVSNALGGILMNGPTAGSNITTVR